MEKEILIFMERLLVQTEKNSLILEEEKEISYGVQLLFSDYKNSISINIYFSKKKGISSVIGGNNNNPLRLVLENCIRSITQTNDNYHSWNSWIGTDESGKGDFFGPLVVSSELVFINVLFCTARLRQPAPWLSVVAGFSALPQQLQ